MSYCVNCGVELDSTCSACPLCQTPVYNPNQPVDTNAPLPFPQNRGTPEPINRNEAAILISVILGTTAVVCLLLNLLILSQTHWSFYVTGICAALWIFLIPWFFPNAVHPCLTLFLDGLGIATFLGVISWLHPGNNWYLHIALPVTGLATLLILVLYTFTIRHRVSFLVRTVILIAYTAILCVVIELLICYHYQQPIRLTWSAIVLICCAAIDIALCTLFFLKGLRTEFRKRMHF